MFIINILYTLYKDNIRFREYIEDKQQEVAFHVMLVMLRAAKDGCINKRSCRAVETDYDIKPTTLRIYRR